MTGQFRLFLGGDKGQFRYFFFGYIPEQDAYSLVFFSADAKSKHIVMPPHRTGLLLKSDGYPGAGHFTV